MNTIAVSISILCDKKNKNKNMKIQTLAQNFAEKKGKMLYPAISDDMWCPK